MSLGTLAILSENLLTGKGAIATSQGREVNMPDEVQLEQVKALLEQVRIFNADSSLN